MSDPIENPDIECSICGDVIQPDPVTGWAMGNNAEPVNNGRCCNTCNNAVVRPARIRRIQAAEGRRG